MRRLIDRIPWLLVIALCLTLGLAPFQPQPHLVEKLGLLFGGELVAPIDVFDLLLHAAPWLLALVKLALRIIPAGTR